jgi:hypothetical protein
MNELAVTYSEVDRLPQTLDLQQKLLAHHKSTLGYGPSTLTAMNNICA